MKNRLVLLLIILLTSNPFAFAAQEGKVVSDSSAKKQVNDNFNEVNQFTDNFFTPHVTKEVVVDKNAMEKLGREHDQQSHGTVPPIKQLRLMIKNRNNPKPAVGDAEGVAPVKDQAILDCDLMQYFAERTELEADGHAVMFFPQNNSTIKADKMIYNQTSNVINAYGNVVLISDGRELFGDYMHVDMNEENALMDNPASDAFQIRARAKKGYMYGDKIIQEQGSLLVTKKTMINIKSEMFGPDLDTMFVPENEKSAYMKDSHGEKFKIKTNDLIINSKKDHDTVTLKHAEVYFNEKKIGTIPSITMHTNKAQDYVEADFPELGTVSNLGLYAGPGFVFDTPKGSTLKVIPMLNYDGGAEDGKTLGFGALAKLKTATNKVDFGYGTVNKTFIMRGKQRLDDNLYFQYAANSFMDDWFMGFRMPKLLGELVYQDSFPVYDFLGKDKDMVFQHRVAAAYVQDGNSGSGLLDGDGSVGTMRFKYMAEVAQTLWKYGDIMETPINARFELVGEESAAVYGTGDTQMVARIGPRLHTQYKWWMQDAGYFLSAYNDKTPLTTYDRYMYGRSNVYMRESARLCKYLTLSWFGSLNLSNDSPDGNMLQENGFYFAIGPDDVKLNIGYDTVRKQSFVTMAMHLDAKGSSIEYKKMVIKNPETLGKNKNGETNQGPSSSFIQPIDDEPEVQKADVIDIKPEAL